MDKFLELAIEFAKDNGVGVTVPIAGWIVIKAMIDDYKEKKDATEKNHDDISELRIKMAALEATVESLKDAVY